MDQLAAPSLAAETVQNKKAEAYLPTTKTAPNHKPSHVKMGICMLRSLKKRKLADGAVGPAVF